MTIERTLDGHRVAIIRDGNAVNGTWRVEIYAPQASTAGYSGHLTSPLAFHIWRKWGVSPQEFLLEEAQSWISDKSRGPELRAWAAQTERLAEPAAV